MTLIFENYAAFKRRRNKAVNGVSRAKAEAYPNYESDNATNVGCWECSECENCQDCMDCHQCKSCGSCYLCVRCSDCYGCKGCSDFSYRHRNKLLEPPDSVVDIHAKVLKWIKSNKSDEPSELANAAVQLSGTKADALAKRTSLLFAAHQVYKRSSPIEVNLSDFYAGIDVQASYAARHAQSEKRHAEYVCRLLGKLDDTAAYEAAFGQIANAMDKSKMRKDRRIYSIGGRQVVLVCTLESM